MEEDTWITLLSTGRIRLFAQGKKWAHLDALIVPPAAHP